MQRYKFDIKHRKGKEHINADALSRQPFVGIISAQNRIQVDAIEFRKLQEEDDELKNIILFLENKQPKNLTNQELRLAGRMELVDNILQY